jgi:methionyl-tRNA formyltransferase
MKRYVVASSRDWFAKHRKSERFNALDIHQIASRDELTVEVLDRIKPRYVFFPHWNWIVPPEIFQRHACVVFHTAPLPYGRGGSPIQNLILRGVKSAPVCALEMTEVLDGGPIYDSREVSLEGTIDQIFARIAVCVEELIITICENEPKPAAQTGEPTYFRRLTPADNELPSSASLNELYDRIRMVDGAGYPKAYIRRDGYRVELSDASIEGDELVAKARIRLDGN